MHHWKKHLYVKQPPGFHIGDSDMVWKLNKSLYGLHQAPLCWNNDLNNYLTNVLGYHRSDYDPCIYTKQASHGLIVLCLYVDDTLVAYDALDEQSWLTDKQLLFTKYAVSDLGDAHWILNMKLTRDRNARTITLSQQAYVEQMLISFGMEQCKPAVNPCHLDLSLPVELLDNSSAAPLSEVQHSLYRSIVGSLLYAANMTRPDISFAVGRLSRHLAAPVQQHLTAAKHVLRYLSGTRTLALIFKPPPASSDATASTTPIVVYCDSSWGNDLSNRKSTSGILVTLFGNAIHWASKKQSCVSLSTTEAEYYAMAHAMVELLWATRAIGTMSGTDTQPGILLCDNQSTIQLGKHHVTPSARTKHIDIKHHFLRDHVKQGDALLRYIPSADNLADLLTKSMDSSVKLSELVLKLLTPAL